MRGSRFAGQLAVSTGWGDINVDVSNAQVVSTNDHEKILIIGHDGEESIVRTENGNISVSR